MCRHIPIVAWRCAIRYLSSIENFTCLHLEHFLMSEVNPSSLHSRSCFVSNSSQSYYTYILWTQLESLEVIWHCQAYWSESGLLQCASSYRGEGVRQLLNCCVWRQHPDPIGYGLAKEAYVESAGPDCIIPGQRRPIRVLGLQVRHRSSAKYPTSLTRICSLVYCAKFILDLVSVSPLYFAAFMPWASISNTNTL